MKKCRPLERIGSMPEGQGPNNQPPPNQPEPNQAHSQSAHRTTGRPHEGGNENMEQPHRPIRRGRAVLQEYARTHKTSDQTKKPPNETQPTTKQPDKAKQATDQNTKATQTPSVPTGTPRLGGYALRKSYLWLYSREDKAFSRVARTESRGQLGGEFE